MKPLQAIFNLGKINSYVLGAFVVIYKLLQVIKFLSIEYPDNTFITSLTKVSKSLEVVFNALKLILNIFGRDVSSYMLSNVSTLEDSLDDLDRACDDLKKIL